MLRQPRRRAILAYRREWLLCHRGADQSIISEIVETLAANDQDVLVQKHDGLGMSLEEFAEFISDEIHGGSCYFIILLSRHLTGPMYREIFRTIRHQVRYTSAFYKMRVEDCDVTGADDLVDLADIPDRDRREREIAAICPTDRARCCGTRAA